MTNRAAARRYAQALFDVAIKEQADLDRVEADLSAATRLFEMHATFRDVMLNPVVPAPRKRAAMADLVTRAELVTVVAKLLLMLAERDRLILLPDLLEAFTERLMAHRRVVRAEVTTAEPLPPDRLASIEQRLATITGRKITMTTRIDPAIIGGIVARVGGTVYDASIATQLHKLKDRLSAS